MSSDKGLKHNIFDFELSTYVRSLNNRGNKYEETLSALDLTLEGQIELSQLNCKPDSCSELLEGPCADCIVSFCMTNIDLVSLHPNRCKLIVSFGACDNSL